MSEYIIIDLKWEFGGFYDNAFLFNSYIYCCNNNHVKMRYTE